jgi:hypothetical protein
MRARQFSGLAATVGCDGYTFRELSDMHRRAGFTSLSQHPVPMSPHAVVMAKV